MRTATIDDVRNVISHGGSNCLSISIPGGGTSESHRLDWSASLTEAKKALASIRGIDVARFLAPIERLAHASRPQANGVVVFRSSTWIDHFHAPATVSREVIVSDRFHVRPLLESICRNDRFFLLDLTHGRVSFFTGDSAGLKPTLVPALPSSFVDAVGTEHADRVVGVSGGGAGRSVWHGQGKMESTGKEDELKFVRAVDEAVRAHLRDEHAPLVVAGSGKLLPLFQSRCSYPHLMTEAVHGSFANAPLEALHALAWPIVQAGFERAEQEVVHRHREAASGDHATDEITSMARFAVEGRIRDLLLRRNGRLAGRMDTSTGAIELGGNPRSGSDADVLDSLAEAVILHGGEVHTLAADRMPTQSPAAATLRW